MPYWAWYASRKAAPSTPETYAHGDLVTLTKDDEPLPQERVERVVYDGVEMAPNEALRNILLKTVADAKASGKPLVNGGPKVMAEFNALAKLMVTPDQDKFHFRCLVDDEVAAKLVAQLEAAIFAEEVGDPIAWPKLDMALLSKAEQDATKDQTKATIIEAPAAYLSAVEKA